MEKPQSSSHHELHSCGYHDGSKREGVRADGGDHDGRDIRVDHGSSRCGSIGCAARRCGNYYTCIGTSHIFAFIFMAAGLSSKQMKRPQCIEASASAKRKKRKESFE